MTAGMWTDGTRTRVRVPATVSTDRPSVADRFTARLPHLAVAACFLAMLCMSYLHVAAGGVNPLSQPLSSYVRVGGGWLFTTGVVAMAGACFAVAAANLTLRRVNLLRIVFVIGGLAFLTAAIFPTDAGDDVVTYSAEIHRYAAAVGMGAIPVGGLLLSYGLGGQGRRTGVARRLLPLVVVSVVLLAITGLGTFLPDFMHSGDWRGVPQRVLLFSEIILLLVVAFLSLARDRVARAVSRS